MMSSAFSERGPGCLGWPYLRPVTVCLRRQSVGYPQSLLVHLRFWGVYHFLHFKGMSWLSTWPGLTDCLQDLDSFHLEGTVDMNERSAFFWERCLGFLI